MKTVKNKMSKSRTFLLTNIACFNILVNAVQRQGITRSCTFYLSLKKDEKKFWKSIDKRSD